MDRRVVAFEDCSAENETPKALHVWIEDFGKHVWIPKSVIHDDSEVYKNGTAGELVVFEWFAAKQSWVP